MLVITVLIPLLLTAAVSASPFTTISMPPVHSSGSNCRNSSLATTAAPDSQPLITAPAATGAPPPEHEGPRPTQPPQLQDLRVEKAAAAAAAGGGFAVSSSSNDGDDGDSEPGTSTATTKTTMTQQQAVAALATDAPPADVPEADSDLARQGYSQVTYYACETFARATHCGWHVPVVEVSGAERRGSGSVGTAAVGAAVCGMLVNWAMSW